jgi:hypothetical protein
MCSECYVFRADGLGRPTTWLVRSKSLTILDFFNKEYVTNTVHADTIHGMHHLRETIYGGTHIIILGRKNKHCMDVCKTTYAAHTEILKMSKNYEEFLQILEHCRAFCFIFCHCYISIVVITKF